MTLVLAAAVFDWASLLVDQVNALITAKGGLLVHDGLLLLAWIGVFKLVLLIAPMLLRRLDIFHANWHGTVHFSDIFILLFQIALTAFALNHWMVALPGGALSLHQIPTALAKGLVNDFDTATLDSFLAYTRDVVKNTEQPAPLAVLNVLVYLWILIQMGMLQLAAFVVASFGFVGIGLYTVLAPLFIPLVLTKHFAGWFWTWLEGLFAFAMYRVMATVIGFIWANVLTAFFVQGVGTDYSIANWIALLPLLLMLSAGFLYSMFKIPAMTSALFSRAGAIGQQYASAIGGGVRAAIAVI